MTTQTLEKPKTQTSVTKPMNTGILLHPKNWDFSDLDPKSRELMKKTIEFFEKKGRKKLKSEDHASVWYSDFIDFLKNEKVFSVLLTPEEESISKDQRWDTYRNTIFSEILGFYGLSYWYVWQVSILGLGPIWMSKNSDLKKEVAGLLNDGGVFAFGLSEKEHGADLISSEMKLTPQSNGSYIANGDKYYIGNGNIASYVSTFGKMSDTGSFVFFAVKSNHPNYKLVQNVVNSQKYVAEFALKDYPVQDKQIILKDREAWDGALATVAFAKFNLGLASVGICEHSFYESLNHAANRILFNHPVTDFSHIRFLFTEAYARLVAMRMFCYRAADYMKVASTDDKRYLLYNPMVKLKVTMQGEEVINLLWDVIAARGFEKDMYFEMATRDIRMLPKLEGTAHINMLLITNFMNNFLFQSKEYPETPKGNNPSNETYLFNQGSTTKGQNKILFHDYNIIYNQFHTPNLVIFKEQILLLKDFLKETPPSKEQSKDIDFMLGLGELFAGIVYGEMILEEAKIVDLETSLLDSIFGFLVKDFSRYAVALQIRPSASQDQAISLSKMVRRPNHSQETFEENWNRVIGLKDIFKMNE
jgi:acyl-CoA dehydrogenase